MIQRSYKVREQHSVGRWFAIEEGTKPNEIHLVIHDPTELTDQRVTITRADWQELRKITGGYSSEWSWEGAPETHQQETTNE